MNDQKINFLKGIKLFENTSDEYLEKLASIAQEVHFDDDEDIFLEGDSGDAIYLVVSGQVKIHTMGRQYVIRSEKDFFGEMAIIDDRNRSASATSKGNSVLLKITLDDFNNVVQNDVIFLRNLLKALVSRLREDIGYAVEIARFKQDILRARELQANILPSDDLCCTLANGNMIQVSGVCYPTENVSGDYYDYFHLSNHQIGIAISDVMGHGFHSGLMVFTTKSCLHTQIASSFDVSNVMSVLNNMVCKFTLSDIFMTFCYFVIDMNDHTISFCNAGHNYPYHYRSKIGNLEYLESGTYPLGISEKIRCAVKKITWDEGDILVLYTDGITEAENKQGEEFGNERLESLIVNNSKLSAPDLKNLIIHELNKYCQDNVYKDDVTLVIVKMGD